MTKYWPASPRARKSRRKRPSSSRARRSCAAHCRAGGGRDHAHHRVVCAEPARHAAARRSRHGVGVLSLRSTALDAVPDLSDVQVIIFSEWMGRAPDLVEDNITYPVVSSMLGSPRVTAVRGQSMFGMSFVNVIFEDGTDMYWARSRVL